MNRRDMVITAVLMNAILLVALFATSKRGVVKKLCRELFRVFL